MRLWLSLVFRCKRILRNPEATGRIVEWALELSSFTLKFESMSTIQSRALAEFIADWTPTPNKEVMVPSPYKVQDMV